MSSFKNTDPNQKRKPDGNKPKRKMKFLTALLIFVIAAAIAVSLFCTGSLFGAPVTNNARVAAESGGKDAASQELAEKEAEIREREQDLKENTSTFVVPQNEPYGTEGVVTDQYDVLSALNQIAGNGDIDYEEEYEVADVLEYGNGRTYRLQQIHDGMPVIGYTLNVPVDASGRILYSDGKHAAGLEGVSGDVQYGGGDAEELCRKYVMLQDQINPDEYWFSADRLSILIREDGTPVTGYPVTMNSGSGNITLRSFFVDANTGEILSDQSEIYEDRVSVNLQGQLGTQSLYVEQQWDDEFRLEDTDMHYEVYDANNASFADFNALEQFYTSQADVISWPRGSESTVKATSVDSLANLEKTYQFYKDIFARDGISADVNDTTVMPVITDVSAYGGTSYAWNDAMFGAGRLIMVGTTGSGHAGTKSQFLDVIAHEFTHGVYNHDTGGSGGVKSRAFGAINEGMADVFGEFVDDYHDSDAAGNLTGLNDSCDWVHAEGRSAITPRQDQVTSAKYFTNQTEVHGGIYLVAHAAYLMNQGIDGTADKRIGNQQLAYFFYDTLPKISTQDTYQDLRRKMELLMYRPDRFAGNYLLTDRQKECVLDAFDQLGYQHSYVYAVTPSAELSVYGVNQKLYEDASVTLTSLDGKVVIDAQDAPGGKLKLPQVAPGVYDLKVDDKYSDGSCTWSVIINDNAADQQVDNYKDAEDLFTNFGGAAGHVVMLLDVSGSMDGTPISQVRKAAANFASTMQEEAPNVQIDLISYSDAASVLSQNEDRSQLRGHISSLGSGGNTNIYEPLQIAGSFLEGEDNTAVMIMSDGLPNAGENTNGDYITPLTALAETIRGRGTRIYTFGFFHSLGGSELISGQDLMNQLADTGYSYNVQSADGDDVKAVFRQIGWQIAHPGNTTHIEVHCPVDVTVRYNGEELSSREGGNRVTSFGVLTFEGEDNSEKVLNLKTGPDYEIIIDGYDAGTMNYSISFADDKGNYTDTRRFENVEIQNGSSIITSASQRRTTEMSADTDGDGDIDRVYTAGKNASGRESSGSFVRIRWILLALAAALGVFLVLWLIRMIGDGLKNGARQKAISGQGSYPGAGRAAGTNAAPAKKRLAAFCSRCGSQVPQGSRFCKKCGAEVEYLEDDRQGARGGNGQMPVRPQSGRGIYEDQPTGSGSPRSIAKIIAIAVLCAEMAVVLALYASPASEAYRKLTRHEYEGAAWISEHSAGGNALSEKYLGALTKNYAKRAERAHERGRISDDTLDDILNTIEAMNRGR